MVDADSGSLEFRFVIDWCFLSRFQLVRFAGLSSLPRSSLIQASRQDLSHIIWIRALRQDSFEKLPLLSWDLYGWHVAPGGRMDARKLAELAAEAERPLPPTTHIQILFGPSWTQEEPSRILPFMLADLKRRFTALLPPEEADLSDAKWRQLISEVIPIFHAFCSSETYQCGWYDRNLVDLGAMLSPGPKTDDALLIGGIEPWEIDGLLELFSNEKEALELASGLLQRRPTDALDKEYDGIQMAREEKNLPLEDKNGLLKRLLGLGEKFGDLFGTLDRD